MLNTKDDHGIPLILGRTFLRTARMLFDVYDGKLILRLGDEKVKFNQRKEIKYTSEVEESLRIAMNDDLIEELVEKYSIPTFKNTLKTYYRKKKKRMRS